MGMSVGRHARQHCQRLLHEHEIIPGVRECFMGMPVGKHANCQRVLHGGMRVFQWRVSASCA
eukprot:1157266-Pelagomonas_calceolata.AAC.13